MAKAKKHRTTNAKTARPPAVARATRPAPRPTTNGGAGEKQATAAPMTAAERGRLRRDELRARRKQESRNRRLTTFGIAAVIVAVLGGILLYRNYQDSIKPGERFADQGNTHIQNGETYPAYDPASPGVGYNSNPPTSGPHYPNIAPWGVSDTRVANELQVHNLEDGGVVIQYKDVPPEVVDQLKGIVGGYEEQVLLGPNETLSHPIVLTAWTRMVRLDAFDEATIVEFIEAYRGIDHHKPGQG